MGAGSSAKSKTPPVVKIEVRDSDYHGSLKYVKESLLKERETQGESNSPKPKLRFAHDDDDEVKSDTPAPRISKHRNGRFSNSMREMMVVRVDSIPAVQCSSFVPAERGSFRQSGELSISMFESLGPSFSGDGFCYECVKCDGERYLLQRYAKGDVLKKPNDSGFNELAILKETYECPSIVTLCAAFHDTQNAYLLFYQDLVEELLEFRIVNDESLSKHDFYRFSAELCLAVHTIHKVGYVITNISPANCFVDEHGHLILANFSKAIHRTDIRKLDYTEGTDFDPPYSEKVSFAGDFWSVGMTMFYIMSGGLNPLENISAPDAVFNSGLRQFMKFDYSGTMMFGVRGAWDTKMLSFIRGLLQQDPKKRLGFESPWAIESITNHEIFERTSFEDFRKKKLLPSAKPIKKASKRKSSLPSRVTRSASMGKIHIPRIGQQRFKEEWVFVKPRRTDCTTSSSNSEVNSCAAVYGSYSSINNESTAHSMIVQNTHYDSIVEEDRPEDEDN